MRNFVKCFLEIKKDGVCLYSIIDIVCKIVYALDKSCVSVERCFLNPCCASWRMLCASRARDYKEISSMDWCSTHDFVLNKQKTQKW